jgi:hypothetical protein
MPFKESPFGRQRQACSNRMCPKQEEPGSSPELGSPLQGIVVLPTRSILGVASLECLNLVTSPTDCHRLKVSTRLPHDR